MEILVKNISELDAAAREFLAAIGDNRHFAFDAPMGAGKTTFISSLVRVAGALDEASSPTFSIVNEYEVSPEGFDGGRPIYHFDFYRVETPEEAMDLGLDDYWDSGSLCLMEWAENVEQFLPEDLVRVEIAVAEDGSRIIKL